MDFRFLYNPERHLFSIGLNVATGRLDQSHYDLLASEACLASFLAVARGEVPRKHWFQLGRLPTFVAGQQGLISWGGTMFEYLMPRLLLPVARGTLLDAAERAAVARQIEYGRENKVPWGISESAFNVLDAAQDYQYQSFGVPGLGLKRGLGLDRVIAPYATLLAVPIAPHEALINLDRLRGEGAEGPFGFCEAIDYTLDRLPEGGTSARSSAAGWPTTRAWDWWRWPIGSPATRCRGASTRSRRSAPRSCCCRSVSRTMLRWCPGVRRRRAAGPNWPRRIRSAGDSPVPTRPARAPICCPTAAIPSCSPTPAAGYSSTRGDALDALRGIDVALAPTAPPTTGGQFIYVRDRADAVVSGRPGISRRARSRRSYEVVYSLDKAEFRRVDHKIETLLEIDGRSRTRTSKCVA